MEGPKCGSPEAIEHHYAEARERLTAMDGHGRAPAFDGVKTAFLTGRWMTPYNGNALDDMDNFPLGVKDLVALPGVLDGIKAFEESLPVESIWPGTRWEPPVPIRSLPVDRLMKAIDLMVTAKDVEAVVSFFHYLFERTCGENNPAVRDLCGDVQAVKRRATDLFKWSLFLRRTFTDAIDARVGDMADFKVSREHGRELCLPYRDSTNGDMPFMHWHFTLTSRKICGPSREEYRDQIARLKEVFSGVGCSVRPDGLGLTSLFYVLVPAVSAPKLFASTMAEAGVEVSPDEAERVSLWGGDIFPRLKHAISVYRATELSAGGVESAGEPQALTDAGTVVV